MYVKHPVADKKKIISGKQPFKNVQSSPRYYKVVTQVSDFKQASCLDRSETLWGLLLTAGAEF